MAQIAAPPRFVPYSTMTDLKRRAEEEAKKKEEEDNDLELSLGLTVGGGSSSAKRRRVAAVDSPPPPSNDSNPRMQQKLTIPYGHVPTFPYGHVPTVPVGAPGYGVPWQYVMPALWNPAGAAPVGGGFPMFIVPTNNGGARDNGAAAAAAGTVESSSHGSSASVISDRQSGSIKGSASSKAKSVTSNDAGDKTSTPEISSSSPRNLGRQRRCAQKTPPITVSTKDDQSPDLELKLEPASFSPPSNEKSKTTSDSEQCAPSMPCVSTTGDGPGGKTITGVLYKYGGGTSDVSIVCACHGKPFTPADFVRHAGGTDIEHPLRQIVVLPS